MSINTNPATVAAVVHDAQAAAGLTDDQLAQAIGYESGRVIAMIKTGKMKLPINKVPQMAQALGLGPLQLFRAVLGEGAPEILAALDAVLPPEDGVPDPEEAKLLATLRKLKAGRKWAPIVFDGSSVIAFMAA